jgi:hypothetical protein
VWWDDVRKGWDNGEGTREGVGGARGGTAPKMCSSLLRNTWQ